MGLITNPCTSKTMKFKLNRFDQEFASNPKKLFGFFRASMLDFDKVWTFKLNGG